VHAALAGAYSEEVADRFFATGAGAVPVPNVLATLVHHPALAGPFLRYNAVLLRAPALGHRLRELAVLRVAWRTRSDYEWAQHVRIAQGLGITPEEIDAIATGDGSFAWPPVEADVLAATDQLLDGYRVEDPTWARLAERLDEQQLVELVFVVGTYTGLAMAFNSFGLELDADLEPVARTNRLPGSEE
jgi:alkylhydroperoxidase family enzyme